MDLQAIIQQLADDSPRFSQWDLDITWQMTEGSLKLLASLLEPRHTTLEVGSGRSTVLFAGAGTRHTAVTEDSNEEELIRTYCDRRGIDHSQIEFAIGTSDDVLPRLALRGGIDVGLVDGAHSFPYPIVDWHYVSHFLRVHGTMIIDDIEIPAARIVYKNMLVDPAWEHVATVDARAAAFAKVNNLDTTDQWQVQPFNVHFMRTPLILTRIAES